MKWHTLYKNVAQDWQYFVKDGFLLETLFQQFFIIKKYLNANCSSWKSDFGQNRTFQKNVKNENYLIILFRNDKTQFSRQAQKGIFCDFSLGFLPFNSIEILQSPSIWVIIFLFILYVSCIDYCCSLKWNMHAWT